MGGAGLLVAGMMSGTSADGVDVVIARLAVSNGRRPRATVAGATRCHVPYAAEQRRMILELCRPGAGSAAEVAGTTMRLGAWFAAAALQAITAAGLAPDAVDLIASHGQTIFHGPPAPDGSPAPAEGTTLQVGAPSVIAALTGITTVGDFRLADMALGGQGAPLVPYADLLLFGSPDEGRVALNIGGISNLTVLPAAARLSDVSGFDSGPGGMVVDGVVEALSEGRMAFDEDGRLAAAGQPHAGLLEELLADPFFAQPPPRSTGRERFGAAYVGNLLARAAALSLSREVTVATATALTALSIAAAYRDFAAPRLSAGPITVIAAGGGARNPTLRRMLQEALPDGVRVVPSEDYGVAAQDREALAFAILGYQTLHGRPTNVPSCTGARGPAVLGVVAPGANYADLLRRLRRR